MSFVIEPQNGDIIVGGFANGIGASPYSGLTDLKSVNPVSIAGEASVSFSTASVSKAPSYSGIGVTVNGDLATLILSGLTFPTLLEIGQAFVLSGSTITGATSGTVYYVVSASPVGVTQEKITFTATYGGSTPAVIGSTGTATLATFNVSLTKYMTKARGSNWLVDAGGLVWSDRVITSGGSSGITNSGSWTYTGNTTDGTSHGNGIVCYQTVTDSTGGLGTSAGVDEWIFVFRNSQIDYTKITANGANTSPAVSWQYGWSPSAGSTGNTQYLQNLSTVNNSHQAIVTPDSRVDYCDANFISVFYQNVPAPGNNYVGFSPTTLATYTFSTYTILPFNDTAQCIAFLNASLLIGGKLNIVYPWNLTSPTYSTPLILLPESNVQSIVTIGQNGYIFAGNRGWIYQTNGSQASPYKKVPDHLSGTVEPLITWGGSTTAGAPTGTATFNKNRLYFGCQVFPQAGGVATGYGGIWCIDVNSGAIWNSNQMSYGTYAGYVSALMVASPQATYSANIGYGLIAGWSDGVIPTYGLDVSVAAPYTGGQSMIVTDMLPIGTALQPTTAGQIEFKLSSPLLSGESVQLLMGSSLYDYTNGNMTSLGTVSGTNGPYTVSDGANPQIISANFNQITLQKTQWIILQAILTGISSSPSYNRLTELRIIGGTIKSMVPTQPYAL